MRAVFFYFLFFLGHQGFLYAQWVQVPISKVIESPINGKTVSFTKFMNTMVNFEPSKKEGEQYVVLFQDINIIFDEKEDRAGMDSRFNDSNAPIWRVKYDVTLSKCNFDKQMWWVVNNLVFEGFVTVSNCNDVKTIFKNCIFQKTLRIDRNDIGFIEFLDTKLEHGIRWHFNSVKDHTKFSRCLFGINASIKDDTRFSGFDAYVIEPRLLEIHQKGESDLTIENCEFKIPPLFQNTAKGIIDITGSNFNNMALVGNRFECNLDFSKTAVENQFLLTDSYISGKLIIDAFNMNPNNTRVQWSSVANNKISVYDKYGKLINGAMRSQIKNEVVFNSLIACYANFYSVFRTQGNRMFANQCYVEWKNIETDYLKNTYKKQGMSVYFNYLMNIFLRDFCDYGTNPLKSVYISFWVLIAFGLVYFVSPFRINYALDNRKIHTIYGKLMMYARYFAQECSLKDAYLESQSEVAKPDDAQKYAEFVRTKRDSLPRFFYWSAIPLAWWHRFKISTITKLYDWLDQYLHQWKKFTFKQKIRAFCIFGTLILLDWIYFTIIRAIDSFTLSLNVFSTLGFGEVPVKGGIRYLTVLEGFVGWFLLSIFSVSLISQVIQ
jgi:hypothetical protein